MSWFDSKRDEFMNWFRNTGRSIADYLDESVETLQEWVNYKPKENPEYLASQQEKQQQPIVQNQEKSPQLSLEKAPYQQQKKPQLELVQSQQPIVQRGLFNKIEVKFEKSDQERER